MEEDATVAAAPDRSTAGISATPTSPPGDAVADQPLAEPVIGDERADIDAILADLRAQAEAEGATDETPAEAEATAAPEATPEAGPQIDPASVAEYLKAQGYTVEPPAPPPDPFRELDARMAEIAGTDEAYAQARDRALAAIPPSPSDTDPDWQRKHDARDAAIAARDAAVAELKQMDVGRTAAVRAREWGWQAAMGRLGQSWSQLPETYGLTPERAKRVQEPASATDAVAAVVEQVSATYEAKLAERERYWQGEVARARTDRTAAGLRAMGGAPQPGAASGGRPAAAALSALFSEKGMPSDDMIERARRGELANLSL